jgi:ATP-dependent Clp protease ATP-binding subunit ClpA
MTRRRLFTLTLVLYPSWWRRRYGEEAAAIAEQTPLSLRSWLDVLWGAVDAWTHQRRPEQLFARFADDAREVIVFAQKEACTLDHSYVGTEHILLGLLAVQDGIAAQALTAVGVSPERVRERLRQVMAQGFASPPPPCGRTARSCDLPKWSMQLTPRTKRGIALSCRAADRLGDPDVSTAHLLLGLLDEGEGIGPRILAELARPEAVRAQLTRSMRR